MNNILASSVLAGSLMAIGCTSSSAPAPATVPPPPTPAVSSNATPPPPAASTLPPEKDMTHSFTKDTPYFADKPTASATPSGTFKAGTKVIVLIPGAPYAKVQSPAGVVAYASIENLEPLGK